MKRLSALLLAALLSVGSAVAPALADTSSVSTFSSASTSNQGCTRYLPAPATLMVVNGLSAAGAAITIKASGAGETTSAVPGLIGPNGQMQTPVITADGLYRVNSAGYVRVCAQISTTGTGNVTVTFVQPSTGNYALSDSASPCNKTASVSITSATTTTIVTGVANKHILVCAYSFTLGGTTPAAQFAGGVTTSTACDTTAANITGALTPTSGSLVNSPGDGGYELFDTIGIAGAADLCIISTGTSPTVKGYLRYGLI